MKLEDIEVIGHTDTPSTLAIELAKSAKRKKDPVVAAVVLELRESGEIVPYWSFMDTGELSLIALAFLRDAQDVASSAFGGDT